MTPGTLRHRTTHMDRQPSPTHATTPGRRARPGHWFLILLTAAVLALASDLRLPTGAGTSAEIGGPFALLLAASTDLGPARGDHIQLTATLHDRTSPDALIDWADCTRPLRALAARRRLGDRRGWSRKRLARTGSRNSRLSGAARTGVLRLTTAARGTAEVAHRGHRARPDPRATHRITRRGPTSCRWTCPTVG